ncbi:MAG: hypothetical protein KGH75_00835 [Rhodospirillales bacterium]|nr:hypothetical protein [Rhodospirillales bacterium]
MSRSGYSEDIDDDWGFIRWRGRVASAARGRRGQQFLRDLVAALDAMPEKRLITGEIQNDSGVCAIGSVGLRRGIDLAAIDPENWEAVGQIFDIAEPLVREVFYLNDEAFGGKTPEQLWQRMRDWAVALIKPVPL